MRLFQLLCFPLSLTLLPREGHSKLGDLLKGVLVVIRGPTSFRKLPSLEFKRHGNIAPLSPGVLFFSRILVLRFPRRLPYAGLFRRFPRVQFLLGLSQTSPPPLGWRPPPSSF